MSTASGVISRSFQASDLLLWELAGHLTKHIRPLDSSHRQLVVLPDHTIRFNPSESVRTELLALDGVEFVTQFTALSIQKVVKDDQVRWTFRCQCNVLASSILEAFIYSQDQEPVDIHTYYWDYDFEDIIHRDYLQSHSLRARLFTLFFNVTHPHSNADTLALYQQENNNFLSLLAKHSEQLRQHSQRRQAIRQRQRQQQRAAAEEEEREQAYQHRRAVRAIERQLQQNSEVKFIPDRPTVLKQLHLLHFDPLHQLLIAAPDIISISVHSINSVEYLVVATDPTSNFSPNFIYFSHHLYIFSRSTLSEAVIFHRLHLASLPSCTLPPHTRE